MDASTLSLAQQEKLNIPYFRGVRLQMMSYVEYRTDEVELYDLKADPYELNNLVPKADPKLLAQLAQRMKDLATCKAAMIGRPAAFLQRGFHYVAVGRLSG